MRKWLWQNERKTKWDTPKTHTEMETIYYTNKTNEMARGDELDFWTLLRIAVFDDLVHGTPFIAVAGAYWASWRFFAFCGLLQFPLVDIDICIKGVIVFTGVIISQQVIRLSRTLSLERDGEAHTEMVKDSVPIKSKCLSKHFGSFLVNKSRVINKMHLPSILKALKLSGYKYSFVWGPFQSSKMCAYILLDDWDWV